MDLTRLTTASTLMPLCPHVVVTQIAVPMPSGVAKCPTVEVAAALKSSEEETVKGWRKRAAATRRIHAMGGELSVVSLTADVLVELDSDTCGQRLGL